MFGSALIIFRETLEAALVLGIIAAATRGVKGRALWLATGVIAGLIGSGVIAGLTETIGQLADGSGQELFNAAVLGIAVLMLAWHHIWMSSHGAELARDARQVGTDVKDGTKAISALAVLVALTVLREGAESVLFLHGLASSSSMSTSSIIAGGALGLAGGVAVGLIMFLGLMRIPVRWFFSVTSTLLLLLAAGLAGQMARFLIQADWLPTLASPIWDMSHILPTKSAVGSVLHVLVGYEASPTGMQMLFYIITLAAILIGTSMVKRQHKPALAVSKA